PRSRVEARGARLPSELTHRTRLRRARRVITCFFDSGSPDQSLAKQTMSRCSNRGSKSRKPVRSVRPCSGATILRHLLDGLGGGARGEAALPQLEDDERPQLGGAVVAGLVALEKHAHEAEVEALARQRAPVGEDIVGELAQLAAQPGGGGRAEAHL